MSEIAILAPRTDRFGRNRRSDVEDLMRALMERGHDAHGARIEAEQARGYGHWWMHDLGKR